MGHQHKLRLVPVEGSGKFVQQTFAYAKIERVRFFIHVSEAGKEVGWWELVFIANNDDLFTKRHRQEPVKDTDLRRLVKNDEVKWHTVVLENLRIDEIGQGGWTHHPA